MSDKLNAIFQFLGHLGLHPASIAAISILIAPAFFLLSAYSFWKLRKSHKIIAQLGKQLGYEPPFDGEEIVQEEAGKETLLRDKDRRLRA